MPGDEGLRVFIPLISSLLGGVIVAATNHWLTLNRDRKKKSEDLNIQRRIDAWKALEKSARVGSVDYDQATENKLKDDFDYAFAEIMLIGTPREIELAEAYAKKCEKGDSSGLDDLLNELRSALRREMRLPKVPEMNSYFRLSRRRNDDLR